MTLRLRTIFPLLILSGALQAQAPASGPWVYQDSLTKESLRGIVNVGGGVAWMSGTHGVIRRTEDGGDMWLPCSIPQGAEKLDFRGIQAWDSETAIVMSSGPGDQSRIYKTIDGCQTWKLVFTNLIKDGFYDALYFLDPLHGVLLGDPVKFDSASEAVEGRSGTLPIRVASDSGYRWLPVLDGGGAPPGIPMYPPPGQGLTPLPGEAFFAASNSSMTAAGDWLFLGTSEGRVIRIQIRWHGGLIGFQSRGGLICSQPDPVSGACPIEWQRVEASQTPIAHDSPSAGIFSIAFRDAEHGMVAGGDYQKPEAAAGTAAWTTDGGKTWTAAVKPPHGYRSSVAWDAKAKAWIAAGTNGSDISYDDGRTWQALDYDNWNALSLPWVVGPGGRVARLSNLPARK